MIPLLLTLPWIGILVFVLFVARFPTELPDPSPSATEAPFVSVVVPARNESVGIERCLRSLTQSTYAAFEVIAVDDRSEDDTADIMRSLPVRNARGLHVVPGEELPAGWLGKPWACRQGAQVAQGDLLLFTDADTVHGTELLGRAVAGLVEERADLMTVVGRQLMETFWERLVQPQIFLLMLFRFPRFERTAKSGRWRDAVANGQFLLFRRAAYEKIGGHEAVKDEVVEDLVLAQLVKRSGLRLRIRSAERDFATRMYRSLGQLVEGWSKNIVVGGLQSVPRWMRSFVAPLSLATGVGLWLVPPTVLAAAAVGALGPSSLVWSGTTYAVSVVVWATFTVRMGASAWHGLLYPLGALVGTYIFLRAWRRGRDVEWKGRSYRLPPLSDRA